MVTPKVSVIFDGATPIVPVNSGTTGSGKVLVSIPRGNTQPQVLSSGQVSFTLAYSAGSGEQARGTGVVRLHGLRGKDDERDQSDAEAGS